MAKRIEGGGFGIFDPDGHTREQYDLADAPAGEVVDRQLDPAEMAQRWIDDGLMTESQARKHFELPPKGSPEDPLR